VTDSLMTLYTWSIPKHCRRKKK